MPSLKRIVALVSMIALLSLLVVVTSPVAAEGDLSNIDLISMVSKLPMMVPFLMTKVDTQACKERLVSFKEETEAASKKATGKELIPHLRVAFCHLGRECTEDILATFMAILANGGWMEKLAKAQLGGSMDLANIDKQMLGYYDSFCSRHGQLKADEL